MGLFDFLKKDNSPSTEKLIKAIRKGNLEIIKGNLELINSLLNGVDVNSVDGKGRTPLMWASFKGGYNTLIKILLEKGADINIKDKEGRTALILASNNGLDEIETVKLLIEAGADINIKDKEGRTAVILALDNGWVKVAKLLMEAGAQINDKEKVEVLALIYGPEIPLPKAPPPFPEFARKHDLSIVVEVEKSKMELQISAQKCTINWGDDSDAEEYNNIKEKNITHRYPKAGNYIITINAEGLSRFICCCSNTHATAIYLNNCPQLEWLICRHNKLTSLDISRCTALKYLSCGGNKLTSLDLRNNLALYDLSCENNLLTCLDISNNTRLKEVDCSFNQLSILNLKYNSGIARLMCNNNQLSKHELNRVFYQLRRWGSSYRTVDTWYSGSTGSPNVFCACGENPGFNSCNKKIAQNKNRLVWRKATYIAATIAGTPGHWQEDFMH